MTGIGGYLELELACQNTMPIHAAGVWVNSGRHAFEYILRVLREKVNRIWIPYYTCEVILQPIRNLGLEYSFYRIDENLEIDSIPQLDENDYLLVNNYFGIKDAYVKSLVNSDIKDKIIIDNAQAWYMPMPPSIKAIYSPRKYFGVPDGGVANINDTTIYESLEQDESYDRMSHLVKRIDRSASFGYNDFRTNSSVISKIRLKKVSKLTFRLLESIDYERVKEKRIENFAYLHNVLGKTNMLDIPGLDSFECPMVYPYRTGDSELRQRLIDNKIFVATYWPNVFDWCEKDSLEYEFAQNLIPLPIDQRYGAEDMNEIINLLDIKSF